MPAKYPRPRISTILFQGFNMPQNLTRYFTFYQLAGLVTTVEVPITRTGIIRNLYVIVNPAPGVGETFNFTLMVNGIATVLTCQIAGADVAGNDLVNAVPVVAGDTICMRCVSSVAAAANADIGVGMELVG